MIALRASQLIGSLQRNPKVNILRTFSAQPNQQHGALPPSDSITSSWSFKLDLGNDAKDSKISVTNIINELIREWLGPRKKKERLRFYHSVRTRSSGREVDKDGFLFKPGERLSVPGYLVRGIIYELSCLSLGDGNLDRLVEKGVVPKELLPPAPDVEPETLGLEDLLASQAGGSRVGSTTRLTDGREGGGIVSRNTPLDMQSQGLGVTQALGLKEIGKGGGGASESSPLKQETESDLVGLLEGRRLSGSQASTSVESRFSRGGGVASAKVLDMAAALDTIKGVARTDEFSLPSETGPRNKRTLADSTTGSGKGSLAWPNGSRDRKEGAKEAEETSNPAFESAPSSTWLTTALEEAKPAQKAVAKAEVELDKRIRNKYEGKLRSIREKAAARKQEGQVSDAPGAFDISQATKVGWKGGAIAVPGSARVKKWRVLPGAGELLAHLKERGLKQGLFSSASDSDRQETLEQLRNFKFSPVEEVTTKEAATGAASSSPETFRRVCDQWGLPPKQVLVVVGPGPIGQAVLDSAAGSGCYLCQMTPYGVTPVLPFATSASGDRMLATAMGESTDLENGRALTGVRRLKQWLGIDDEVLGAQLPIAGGQPQPHFLVEDVPGLKAVVEDLNGVSYRRSTMMRGLGSGRERAAASADNERVFV